MKIVKSSKRVAPPHPAVSQLINKLLSLSTDDVAPFLATISEWTWARSDLGNWVAVLDKFDAIIADIIRDYDVDKLQLNPFTPLTKSTILEILRFERMLLDNSTGRKLFASYDRLNSLLTSSDLDVVVADLKLLLRPSQQYSSAPPSAQTSNISSSRLLALSQSWSALRDQGVELHEIMDAKRTDVDVDLSGPAGDVHFQFYRKATDKVTDKPTATETTSALSTGTPSSPQARTTKPASGAVNIHIPGVASSDQSDMTILAEAMESYNIPEDERFALLCKIRMAKVLPKGREVERENLLVVRLLAISIYAHSHSETQATTTLFLYNPDLVAQIVELLHPDRDIPLNVVTAAMIALDALGRYRAKITEVLTSLNAGVSHGILLSLVRRTVSQLRESADPVVSEVAETLIALLLLLTAAGGTMLVGAGLLPLIIQILDVKDSSRLSVVSKVTVLIDNVIYTIPNTFQLFCNNSGVDSFVQRIEHEVQTDIEEGAERSGDPQLGSIPLSRHALLKHLLRSMHRMMQSSGSHEGLRTLIDSSLPGSVKKIMEHRHVFGHQVFALGINTMSLFVHNEPTSLSILQEARIPDAFYTAIESGIDASAEVLAAIPNALGALCLNPAGEAQLSAHPTIIPSIFSAITSDSHVKVLGDKEYAISLGQAMDELVRHHPALKPQVFGGIINMLERIEELGKTWTPPKSVEWAYKLPSPVPTAAQDAMDVDQTTTDNTSPTEVRPQSPSAPSTKEDDPLKVEDNIVVTCLEVAAKVLDGFFAYAPHCRDFIVTYDGIKLLGLILKTAGLPIRFSESVAGDAVFGLFRMMAELNPKETFTKVSELVRSSLDESRAVWDIADSESRVTQFIVLNAESDMNALNVDFRSFVSLQVILSVLGDIYSNAANPSAHFSRGSSSILQVLSGKDAPEILDDLGKVHRTFLWENLMVKKSQTAEKKDKGNTETPTSAPITDASTSTAPDLVGAGIPNTQVEGRQKKPFTKGSTSAGVLYTAAQIPLSLMSFFQAVGKLSSIRSRNDSGAKAVYSDVVKRVTQILRGHCRWRTSDDQFFGFAYGTLVISFITTLLHDERAPQSSLHTLLLINFRRDGGLDSIMEFGKNAVAFIASSLATPPEARTKEDQEALSYAYGLLNVSVHLLGLVTSARPLLDSSQTPGLITRDKDIHDENYFSPQDFIVKVRAEVAPFLRDTWQSSWLQDAPMAAVKSVLSAVVEIAAAEHEVEVELPSHPAMPTIHTLQAQLRQTAAPDENAISQLTDMGFSRNQAEHALVRTHNNVNAAAEHLISHPGIYANMPPIRPVPVPAAVPAPEVLGDPAPPSEVAAPNAPEPEVAPSQPHEETRGEDEDDQPAVSGGSDSAEMQPSRDWKRELDELRATFRDGVVNKALLLADSLPALVFEVKAAILRLNHLKEAQGLSSLLSVETMSDDSVLATRGRLLALVLNDSNLPVAQLPSQEVEKTLKLVTRTLSQVLTPETVESTTLPSWLPSHVLAADSLLLLGDGVEDVAVPTPEQEVPNLPPQSAPAFQEERTSLFQVCLRLIGVKDLGRDEMLAVLRLLLALTRDQEKGALLVEQGGVTLLLNILQNPSKDVLQYRTTVFMILRHVIEDQSIVEATMRHQLQRYFGLSRRASDVGSVVRNTSPLALRNPKLYLSAFQSIFKLSPLQRAGSPSYSLVSREKEPVAAATEGGSVTESMQIDEPSKPSGSASLPDSLVHAIMTELLGRMKPTRSQEVPVEVALQKEPEASDTQAVAQATSGPAGSSDDSSEFSYTCMLMQLLAELLISYDVCKLAFVSFHKRKPATSLRPRASFLPFILSDIITVPPMSPSQEAQHKVALSSWGTAIVTSLCTDTSPSPTVKESSDVLVSARKFALEGLSKAMKDLPLVADVDARFDRMHGLAELCYRLLTFHSSPVPGSKEDTNVPIAKIMLEKNFVATMVSVLADIDLNHPSMKTVGSAVMRPLEHLTKIAIKMGRASNKTAEGLEDAMETDSSSDEEPGSDREETPNLYQNSSLGMFGGEMEDAPLDPDEDDEMEEEGDEMEEEEMEYEETNSSGTEPSVDEGEEDADHEQDMDVGMEDGQDATWIDEVDEAGTEEDDDAESLPDPIVEAEADIVWQGNPEDDVIVDAVHVDQDDPVDGGNDDESSGVSDEDAEGDPPSDDEIILDYADAMVGEEDGGWMIAPQWNAIPPLDHVESHRQAALTARRNQLLVSDPYVFGGPSRRSTNAADSSVHPLLVEQHDRPDPDPPASRLFRRYHQTRALATGGPQIDIIQAVSEMMGGEPMQVLRQLIAHTQQAGVDGFRIELGQDAGALINTLERDLGRVHHMHHHHGGERRSRTQPHDPSRFLPQGTLQRWADESRLMNPTVIADRIMKLANVVTVTLLPEAREAAKKAKEEAERLEADKRREAEERAAEEAKAEAERERLRREEEEEERRVAEAKAEAERAAAEADAAAAAAAAASSSDVAMEDVDGQNRPETSPEIAPSEPADPGQQAPSGSAHPRVTVLVHGNPVDITDTGIDVTFLEALPDDMREEIINQHFRERSTTRVEPAPDSQISPEFLDALPPDIRDEILRQEAADRRRREPPQAVQPPGGAAGPSDIDTADFLASLDPSLRQAVLMEQDEGFLQTLPSNLLADVNMTSVGAARRRRQPPPENAVNPPTTVKKPVATRDSIQLLDKTGITALVRLLFAPQAHKRGTIHKVLLHLCENGKTRQEVLNLLLTLLQNGTADMVTVDKSFSQMSMKTGKVQTPKSTPRKAVADGSGSLVDPTAEHIPNLIAQRCLEAITALVTANELCSVFFLTEHELPGSLKKSVSKKGKGKEKSAPQTHYPIILLLSLLDKPNVLKTPSLMDLVAGVLSSVTKPLSSLKDSASTSPSDGKAAQVPNVSASSQESGAEALSSQDAQNPSAESDPPVVPAPVVAAPEDANGLVSVPPQIPHSVLRLIVNLLTAGECSSRTFQQTLTLIQHLSHLPDARETVASELRSRAQELGQCLYSDLSDLLSTLEKSSADESSIVITKFSPASSDQAKLLRVLKTIDYMYTTKPATSPADSTPGTNADDQEKAQLIYQSFRFNALWNKLGDCLTIVSEQPDTDHVATVLLPLIESLMVVCKYVSGMGRRVLRDPMSPRSPTTPRESTEDLFVSFTDAHRKILNSMVRNNPSLMSGSFSLLVNNPRVLDFDNKRNYFTQKLRRRPANREHYGTLQVNVRRQRVFEDSFQHLQRSSGEQIKYGKLSVRFYDEEGVDAGGVTREWFQILARQMFNPDYALFQPCAADRLTYQPNQASWVNSEHLSFFKFVGRIIGKAIFDGRLLDAYFARSLYRQMLGKPVDYRDVEWVDPEYYKSLVWILDNDPSVLDLNFSVESNNFGLTKTIPLKENGHTIPVTNENKREYVQLSAEYRLVLSIKDQIEAFLNGFYDIIPKDLIAIFNEQELELLISGTPDIDVDEWKGATDYTGYTAADPVIVWWWRALKSFNRDERAKVLSFATGTSKVPLGGFTELQGVQGVQRFSIHKAYGDSDRLPSAHTCFNQIDLPQYTSYEKLRTQLLLAINEGGEGFGFA